MCNSKKILFAAFSIIVFNSCSPEEIPEEKSSNSKYHINADTGDQADEPEHRNGG